MTKPIMDMDEIKKRIDRGLISVRKHPFLDLYIYNYTSRTQFDRLWDQYTEICRGLIMDDQNNVLNNPFPKFYNLGETEKTKIQNLPAEIPSITEKLDGMLGILYAEGDKPAIATRGRFDSPYAIWATNWLRQKGFSLEDFKVDYTYLFEIVYPNNKIVVNYGNRAELVLLAVRNNDDGHEIDYIKEAERLGLSYAKEFFVDNYGNDKVSDAINYLQKSKGIDEEGFVCKYSNGLRIKIKSVDYMRLSKILFGLSSKGIWEIVRDKGNVEDILESVPDEFYDWVKKVEASVTTEKEKIMNKAKIIAKEAKKLNGRVEQSEYIRMCTENNLHIRGVAFFLLDDRIDKAEFTVWKMVRPSGELFSTNEDDGEMIQCDK